MPTSRVHILTRLCTVGPISKEAAIEIGIAYAETAIKLDPADPLGYMQLGNLVQLKGAHQQAIELREKAVRLAPNSFDVWWGLGGVLLRAGQAERGLAAFKRAAHFAPRPPPSFWWGLTHVELVLGDVEAAVTMAERTVAMKPENPDGLAYAAMAFVAAGRARQAQKLVAEILQIAPPYSVAQWRNTQSDFRDRASVDRLATLLTEAGLP